MLKTLGDPQGQELTAHVPRRWIKKKKSLKTFLILAFLIGKKLLTLSMIP